MQKVILSCRSLQCVWTECHVTCGCTPEFRVSSEEGKRRGAGLGACVRPALPSPWGRERLRPLPGLVWPTFPLLTVVTQMAHTGPGEAADSNWGLGGQASSLQTALGPGSRPLAPNPWPPVVLSMDNVETEGTFLGGLGAGAQQVCSVGLLTENK